MAALIVFTLILTVKFHIQKCKNEHSKIWVFHNALQNTCQHVLMATKNKTPWFQCSSQSKITNTSICRLFYVYIVLQFFTVRIVLCHWLHSLYHKYLYSVFRTRSNILRGSILCKYLTASAKVSFYC